MLFFEFTKLLNDQLKLILYFQERSLLHKSMVCDRCIKDMQLQEFSHNIDGYCFRCTRCKTRKSLRGDLLRNSKLDLKTFASILYFHHLEVLQKHIAEQLNITEKTVVDFCHFIREQCSKSLLNSGERLGGVEIRVQVDESVLSAAKLVRIKVQDLSMKNGSWVHTILKER